MQRLNQTKGAACTAWTTHGLVCCMLFAKVWRSGSKHNLPRALGGTYRGWGQQLTVSPYTLRYDVKQLET